MKRLAPFVFAAIAIAAACSIDHGIPDVLQPADESLALVATASGVQVYECRERPDLFPFGYEWTLVGPEATLYDGRGHRIGFHDGAYWRSLDGSRVIGGVAARMKAPVDDAISWQLLTTKSDGPPGAFSAVTSIRRMNTHGGMRPANPCDARTARRRMSVPYTADYHFFVARP
jgi:hypothetical protein